MNKFFGKIGWFSLLVLTLASPVSAQDPIIENGQPEELRGVTKVFVDTGPDAQRRGVIVREIQKLLPDLEIVTRPEESDIHLRLSQKETRDGRTEWAGTVVKLIGGNRVRALYNFKAELSPLYEQHSIMNFGIERMMPLTFAREFVRAYKKANG